jgi:hypothetical protein
MPVGITGPGPPSDSRAVARRVPASKVRLRRSDMNKTRVRAIDQMHEELIVEWIRRCEEQATELVDALTRDDGSSPWEVLSRIGRRPTREQAEAELNFRAALATEKAAAIGPDPLKDDIPAGLPEPDGAETVEALKLYREVAHKLASMGRPLAAARVFEVLDLINRDAWDRAGQLLQTLR